MVAQIKERVGNQLTRDETAGNDGKQPPTELVNSNASEDLRGPDEDCNGSRGWARKLRNVLTYTPHRCRYDPTEPPRFSTWLNILFAFAGCFTVIIQPFLVLLSF